MHIVRVYFRAASSRSIVNRYPQIIATASRAVCENRSPHIVDIQKYTEVICIIRSKTHMTTNIENSTTLQLTDDFTVNTTTI